jgi:hypothetical protein
VGDWSGQAITTDEATAGIDSRNWRPRAEAIGSVLELTPLCAHLPRLKRTRATERAGPSRATPRIMRCEIREIGGSAWMDFDGCSSSSLRRFETR